MHIVNDWRNYKRHFLQRDVSQLNQHDLSFNQQLLNLKTLQNEQLLNVSYKISNNQLVRVDFSDLKNPVSLKLLKGVSSFKVQALGIDNRWKNQWTPELGYFVKALKIELTHEIWGVVETIIIVNA